MVLAFAGDSTTTRNRSRPGFATAPSAPSASVSTTARFFAEPFAFLTAALAFFGAASAFFADLRAGFAFEVVEVVFLRVVVANAFSVKASRNASRDAEQPTRSARARPMHRPTPPGRDSSAPKPHR